MKPLSVAALILLDALSASAAPTSTPVVNNTSKFQIRWAPCPNITGLDCGQLRVPVDWSQSNGSQITLGVERVNATNSSARIGSVIFNPGGPGGVATTLCQAQAEGIQVFGDALTQHFDIICPDPRGIGTSTPIKCDPKVWNSNVTRFPTNESQFNQLIASNKARGESCLNLTGPLVQHIDTASVANDIEAIRIALNDGKLNYLALSYGTFLGTTYAELYPQNIRAMVLDAVVNHDQYSYADVINTESQTYQNVLDIFFDWCAANSTACGGFQGSNLPQMYDTLVANANKSPIPAPGCAGTNGSAALCMPTVSGQDIQLNTQDLLLFKFPIFEGFVAGWEALGAALNASIANNDATGFSTPLATEVADAAYPDIAIACLDWTWPSLVNSTTNTTNITAALTDFKQWQIMGNAFNSHIGPASQSYYTAASCIGWPASPVDTQHVLNQTAMALAPPMLLVNAIHDPSTSYAWAVGVNEQIPRAVLLTRDGDGHTSYFLHGDAAAAMDTYLVNLTLPAPGTIVMS